MRSKRAVFRAVACLTVSAWVAVGAATALERPPEARSRATPARKREVKEKLTVLVAERYAGDSLKAFRAYDRDGDGAIAAAELKRLLKDADVGNWLTRGAWTSGVLAEADADKDGSISVPEFQAAFKR